MVPFRWGGDSKASVAHIPKWIELGARIIGMFREKYCPGALVHAKL